MLNASPIDAEQEPEEWVSGSAFELRYEEVRALDGGVGCESKFCDHQEFTRNTHVPIYFATPYRSIERVTNENAKGLVRYFLSKKTHFHTLSQTRLNEITRLLYHRPRACLGFLTPHKVHFR